MDGVLWVLRSGVRWSDLPPRRGAHWKSVHRRFCRWARAGVWERLFQALSKTPDNEYRMIDSTIIRAHQQAAAEEDPKPRSTRSVPLVTGRNAQPLRTVLSGSSERQDVRRCSG